MLSVTQIKHFIEKQTANAGEQALIAEWLADQADQAGEANPLPSILDMIERDAVSLKVVDGEVQMFARNTNGQH